MTLEPPFNTPAYNNYREQLEEQNKKKLEREIDINFGSSYVEEIDNNEGKE